MGLMHSPGRKPLKKGRKVRLNTGPRAGDRGRIETFDGNDWAYVHMDDGELRKEQLRNLEEI